MRILLFICMILLPLVCKATPVVFTNASTTFTLPAGFTRTNPINPKWDYFTNASTTGAAAPAGIRTMGLMSSILLPDADGNYGLAWIAQLNNVPFEGVITFTSTMETCADGVCTPLVITGSLGYGANGLQWVTRPQPLSFKIGTVTYDLVPSYSTKQGVIIPQDAGFTLKPSSSTSNAPVPEPATLMMLSAGLSGLVALTRRRKQ